jgi:catechol 2,3-dioxygenase-like lactoylglutathione lyase family enzyme
MLQEERKMMIENRFDHVGLNVIDLEASISFLKEMFGFEVIQRWDSPRQAFVGKDRVVLGVMEVKDYDFSKQTMAHIAFPCRKEDFGSVVDRLKRLKAPIVSGPKAQRDGETILFRDPSGNIFEVCYPPLRK